MQQLLGRRRPVQFRDATCFCLIDDREISKEVETHDELIATIDLLVRLW
jgi:hypothetical protein